jgi:hypothetical protein
MRSVPISATLFVSDQMQRPLISQFVLTQGPHCDQNARLVNCIMTFVTTNNLLNMRHPRRGQNSALLLLDIFA